MGVVNDKLFLDIDDIICVEEALRIYQDLWDFDILLKKETLRTNPEQMKVTQKKIRDVYSELFGNDDK